MRGVERARALVCHFQRVVALVRMHSNARARARAGRRAFW